MDSSYFYKSLKYQKKQSDIMKENWRKGLFNFHYKRVEKSCARMGCKVKFEIQASDPKMYCGKSCAAIVNNAKRGGWPEEVKRKISNSLRGRDNPFKGVVKIPRE